MTATREGLRALASSLLPSQLRGYVTYEAAGGRYGALETVLEQVPSVCNGSRPLHGVPSNAIRVQAQPPIESAAEPNGASVGPEGRTERQEAIPGWPYGAPDTELSIHTDCVQAHCFFKPSSTDAFGA